MGYQSVRAQQILILNKGLLLLISALSVSYRHMVCCRGHHDSSCSYAITMFDAWLDNLLYVQQKCGKAFPVNRVCTVSVTNRESHIQLHRLGCGMGRDLMSFHYQSQKQSMYELTRRKKGLCYSYVAARNVKMFHCKRSLRKAARGQLLPARRRVD